MFFEETRIRTVREMILPKTNRPAAPRSQSCCRCSARTSSSCSRS
jgi:hypothetical protein